MNEQYRDDKMIEVYKDTLLKGCQYAHGMSYVYSIDRGRSPIQLESTARVIVLNIDTVSALQVYAKYGKCAVLNMASAKTAGGGVTWGAKAQEEALFRCSNLAFSIDPKDYPLGISEAIYSMNATFFKDFHYNDINPLTTDVITIAAYKRPNELDIPRETYEHITEKKIVSIFSEAIENDVKILILGAWGCGVYKNDPQYISGVFKKVIADYKNSFESIIFAIINDKNSVSNNFEIFRNTLQ